MPAEDASFAPEGTPPVTIKHEPVPGEVTFTDWIIKPNERINLLSDDEGHDDITDASITRGEPFGPQSKQAPLVTEPVSNNDMADDSVEPAQPLHGYTCISGLSPRRP